MEKLFIVGCPRSGTTMVQQALNRHSRIVIPPETKFFFSFFGLSRRRQLRHLERLNADLGIHIPAPPARVRSAAQGRALFDDVARRYVERLGKRDVAYFGDKTPEHTGRLPLIRGLFPGAKVVVLYRDGRDVAASLTRMPWASPDLYVNFAVWLYYHRVVRRALDEGWPGLYRARYEDLVAAPERELGGILRFLGLPYEPAVAEGWGNREGVPEREHGWKGRALRPITAARVGIFRHQLSPGQVAILERLGRHALPSLGYPLTTGGRRPLPPDFFLRLSWDLSRFVCRLPWGSVLQEVLARLSFARPDEAPPLSSPAGVVVGPPGRPLLANALAPGPGV